MDIKAKDISITFENEDALDNIVGFLEKICTFLKGDDNGTTYTVDINENYESPKDVFDKYEEDDFEDFVEPDDDGPERVFGAGFEIDEPRACDYDSRKEFLEAHELFDRFVEAGEACVAAGLEKPDEFEVTKCHAIKKNVGDTPPIGIELIGETQWECD